MIGSPGDGARGGGSQGAQAGAGRRHGHALAKAALALLVGLALGYLVFRLRGDIARAWRGVGPGGLPWMAAAVGAEAVSFLCYAGVQHRLLSAGGASLPRPTVVGLTMAATGLTNLVPGGTAPSSGWLVLQYRRRGVPLPLALWAVLAGGFAAAISVLAFVVVGAAVAGLVDPWEGAGLAVLLVGVAAGGVVGTHRLPALRRWLVREHRVPGIGLVRRVAGGLGEVGRFRATVPGGALVYGLSLANWALDVAVLACAFAVLDLPVPWRALLFAYAAAQVAGAISPLPGGIGFVEGGMIGAFALAGAPAGSAVVATVVYRLVTTLGMGAMGGTALLVVNRRRPVRATLSREAAGLERSGPKDRPRDSVGAA